MTELDRFSIGARLSIAFAALIIVMIAVFAAIFTQTTRSERAAQAIDALVRLEEGIQEVSFSIARQKRVVLEFMATSRPSALETYAASVERYERSVDDMRRRLAPFPDMAALFEEAAGLTAAWRRDVAERQIALMRNALTINAARAIEYTGVSKANTLALDAVSDRLAATISERLRAQRAEQAAAARLTETFVLAGAAASIALAALLAVVLTRSISRPIGRLTSAMSQIAADDLTVEIPHRDRRDEIGEMAQAMTHFREALAENAAAREMRSETERNQRRAVADRMRQLAQAFDDTMRSGLGRVGQASDSIQTAADDVGRIGVSSGDHAFEVAESAARMVEETQAVVASTSQLTASNAEIANQVGRTATIAEKAESDVDGVEAQIKRLHSAVTEIGDVAGLITDIAEQTNLLALNATIEAARAGDAGRGFAVVANEVKALAAQTAEATDSIGGKITTIQRETNEAVDMIADISRVVTELRKIAEDVLKTIVEQVDATEHISRNIGRVGDGVEDVSQASRDLSFQAVQSAAGWIGVIWTVDDLSQELTKLREAADRFVSEVRQGASDAA